MRQPRPNRQVYETYKIVRPYKSGIVDDAFGLMSLPAAVLRAGYSHRLDDGSEPSVAVTVRRFAASDPNLHNAALQAVAISASDF